MENAKNNMGKVLIIEDEAPLRVALVEKFSQECSNVLQAHNGQEGLEVALKEHPDLILLDLMMPKMDGFQMIRQLKLDDWGKSAKVLILTNFSEDSLDIQELKREGYEVLVKTDNSLEEIVEMACRKSKSK
jgi:DNA-binding response OmpR family regulator